MSEHFTQVKIEDVKPGDIARTDGGQEFEVMRRRYGATAMLSRSDGSFSMSDGQVRILGVTFWRKTADIDPEPWAAIYHLCPPVIPVPSKFVGKSVHVRVEAI